MPAARTGPAGVLWGHRDQVPTVPRRLVVQLPAELEPTLIENGFVQAGLGPNVGARRFHRPGRRRRHVANLQVLDAHHRVVFADRGRGLVQVVAPGVADAGMDALDVGFRLLPVVAELGLAAHGALRLHQRLFLALEAVEGLEHRAVAQGGEADNTHVDPDGRALVNRDLGLALGLDRHGPLAARLADGDVLHRAEHIAALAVAQPTQLGQEQAAVGLVELDLFRVGVAEAVAGPAFLLEAGKVGALGEEVGIGPLQILEGLLQRMHRGLCEPRGFRAVAPLGEALAQRRIPELFRPLLVQRLLHRQRPVEDKAARSGEAAHVARLIAVGHQLELEGLETLHVHSIVWSMSNDNDIRHGRHCVFAMHVHLVFVAKYRRKVFDGEAIASLRAIFAKVCTDFEATLVEMDGEDDHVHLLVEYPPKVAVSALVNSLKGVSSRLLRQERPDIQRRYWKGVLWSPSYFAASCGGAPISIVRQYIEQQQTPH